MNYEEFITAVKHELEYSLPQGYTVHLTQILKNNNITYDGINIFYEGACYSPNIYLNPYYDDYRQGVSMDEITENIKELFVRHKNDLKLPLPDFGTFHPCFQEKIFFRLINAGKNKALLKTVPHIPFLDLAITFHLLVTESAGGIGSIRITHELCKSWKLSTKQLLSYARKNTPKLFPATFHDMEYVLHDLLMKDLERLFLVHDSSEPLPESSYEDLIRRLLPKSESRDFMYILSNTSGINGATSLLYKDELKTIARKIGEDFYILPSSVHEVILIPASLAPSHEELSRMVQQVNETQVPDEDILSDRAYYYRREDDLICME